jgi:hypothetical protein
MKRRIPKTPAVIVLTISLVLSACSGCGSDNGSDGQLKLHPIYQSALLGAAVGAVIGHQSDEAGNGAALGAAVFGIGALLEQTDRMSDKRREHEDGHEEKQEEEQEVVIQIKNDNGSVTTVVLKKEGGSYVGPNGEHYKRLPTAEQLKPVYGL